MTGGLRGRFQNGVLGASPKIVSPIGRKLELWSQFAPWPLPFLPGLLASWPPPLTLLSSQGLYQWVYHTHEDAQEARASQESPGEDPNGEGTQEEDQPDSGNWTGGQCDRDLRGAGSSCVSHSSPIPSRPSPCHHSLLVSDCCCNKVPQTWWLKTVHIYYHIVLEVRSLK